MAFGQPAGPPASGRQIEELLALLFEAGYCDFRDARGPMRFTQRQAGGRFTRSEADALIEQLRATGAPTDPAGGAGAGAGDDDPPPPPREPMTAAERRRGEQLRSLRQVPPELLAGELQRRGWIVMAP